MKPGTHKFKEPLTRVSALILGSQKKEMDQIYETYGIPLTEQIRQALKLYLKRYRK